MCYHIYMARTVLAQIAVDNQEVYGRWRVEGRVENSTRKVKARCLDCENIYVVDLFTLRRKDRKPTRCQSCNNKILAANNRLDPGVALRKETFNNYRKNARARGYEWNLDFDRFVDIISGFCWYCGEPPSRVVESAWDSILVNGIDRRDNSLGYIDYNVVPCCKNCNYAKRDLNENEFIELCKKVAKRNDFK